MIDLAIKEKTTAFITNRHIASPKKIYDILIFQTESETFKLAHSKIITNSKFKLEGINETISRNSEVSEKQQETQGSKDLVLPNKVLEEEETTQSNRDNINASKPQKPTDSTTSISSWAYSLGVSPDVIDKLKGMGVETLEDAVAILCSQYEADEGIQDIDSNDREEILPSDFSFKNMDIGGLDEELGTVFRRIFQVGHYRMKK